MYRYSSIHGTVSKSNNMQVRNFLRRHISAGSSILISQRGSTCADGCSWERSSRTRRQRWGARRRQRWRRQSSSSCSWGSLGHRPCRTGSRSRAPSGHSTTQRSQGRRRWHSQGAWSSRSRSGTRSCTRLGACSSQTAHTKFGDFQSS